MDSSKNEIEIDIREIFLIIKKHILLILAVTLLSGLLAGLISTYALTPEYTSTSKIYILTNTDTTISLSDLQTGSSLANDYAELIKSRPVVEQVARNLKLNMTYGELLSCISINNPANTRILWIQVTYTDPTIAMEIANEFATVAKQQISQIMMVDEPRIAEEAVAAEKQSSPNNVKNTLLGAGLGMIAVIAVLIIGNIMDDTVKTGDDVERYLDMHMLAAVPEEGGTDNSEKKKKKKIHGIRKESFHR